jgi:hypothetical protein
MAALLDPQRRDDRIARCRSMHAGERDQHRQRRAERST